ncbi:RNA-binding protein 33-like isoform X1 [Schistocerca serialis cubense]|uniref:RNA-binding protein 33-like isoform X1 n=1 Tax=Schistocerca serialis cubense TaxID=2023355 RepID=UPI00214E0714|nr:RNA-binding protein 33-like isoform X1 [Schistocerca serialis cubense]XP_049938539.1 RNA-binding protein 33-like isoform X1 [Schistocerca serialis cubense]
MSDNNDINLLDDDLEDDIDYDLGNEDEDRLLADDYELQDSSELEGHDHGEILESDEKSFVETDEPAEDDILDLGVTDGLDDLDSEIQESADVSQQKLVEEQSTFGAEIEKVTAEPETTDPNHSVGSVSTEKNNAEDVSAETTTHVESEEEEESEMESRDRFKSERTNIVPLKSSKTFGNIPDTLDSVIPSDDVNVKRKWRGKKGWAYSRQSGSNMRGGLNQRFHQQQQHYQQKLQPFHSFQNSGPHFAQMQQPPQKILINPHFRGAVQPHSDARLIWDREGGVNNGFPQRMMGNEDYGQMPHGGFDGPFQQNPNPPSAVLPDGLHPHHHHQNQSYPPPLHASQQQPQYYNENYMEQPPTHAPVPSGPEPWLNHSMMQQPPAHHQIPPPQAPPDNFFLPPPRDTLMFPPPQQQFPPFQEQGPRFPPPGNFMPPPDMHIQGAFRVPPPGQTMGPGGRFRQPVSRFQNMNMKRRVHYQGPPNGPKRIASPKQQNVVSSSQHSQQPETSTPQQQPPVKVVPVKRLDSTPRRKKRMPDMSNLHEVKTVDTLPVQAESTATSTVATASTTNEEGDQEDEETREYRRKIEEQKRLREKVLQAKEIRRMMAALEKQRLLKKQQQEPQQGQEQQQHQTGSVTEKLTGGVDPSNVEPPKGNAIATIVNRNPVQPLSTQVTPTGVRKRTAVTRVGVTPTAGIQRQLKHQQKHQHHFHQQHQQIPPQQQFLPQGGQQLKQHPIQKVSVVTKQSVQGIPVLRKNIGGPAASKSAPGMQPGRIVRAPSQQASGTATVVNPKRVTVVGQQQLQARKVVLRGASSGTGVQLLTGQQQQRVVIQKSTTLQGQQAVASPNRTVIVNQVEAGQQRTSKSVAVENLSVDTDEMKLRRMCLRVGTVEKVQMQPQHRRAVITFANPSSAGMFIDRYQRKIVDLSLIQVSLVP